MKSSSVLDMVLKNDYDSKNSILDRGNGAFNDGPINKITFEFRFDRMTLKSIENLFCKHISTEAVMYPIGNFYKRKYTLLKNIDEFDESSRKF